MKERGYTQKKKADQKKGGTKKGKGRGQQDLSDLRFQPQLVSQWLGVSIGTAKDVKKK